MSTVVHSAGCGNLRACSSRRQRRPSFQRVYDRNAGRLSSFRRGIGFRERPRGDRGQVEAVVGNGSARRGSGPVSVTRGSRRAGATLRRRPLFDRLGQRAPIPSARWKRNNTQRLAAFVWPTKSKGRRTSRRWCCCTRSVNAGPVMATALDRESEFAGSWHAPPRLPVELYGASPAHSSTTAVVCRGAYFVDQLRGLARRPCPAGGGVGRSHAAPHSGGADP